MSEEKTIAPKSRFGEFTSKWNKASLGNVVELSDSLHKTPSAYTDEGYPMIRVADINNSDIDFDSCLYVDETVFTEFTKKYEPQRGDIILSRVGTCGASAYLKTERKVCLGQNTVLMRPKLDNLYFLQFIRGSHFAKQVARAEVGSSHKTLSLTLLKKFDVPHPTLPEQEKIAAFLSSVDSRIEQLQRKKSLLQDYKKGVLQRLFSQQLRFKDDNGTPYPDWEEKKLGEIGKVVTGGTPDTSNASLYNGQYLFVSPADINETRLVKTANKTLSEQGHTSGRIIPEGSVMFVCIGSTIGKLAQASTDCTTNQQINSIVPHQQTSATYLYYAVKMVANRIKLLAGNQAVPIINKTEFSKNVIPVATLPEQTKIANFLSTLDTKIEQVTQQITQTQTFKKGLLQQMFV